MADQPFDPSLLYSAAVRKTSEGKHLLVVKGATEQLLERSTRMLTEDGEEADLDADAVRDAMEELADRCLRVLGMAYARLDEAPSGDDELDPRDLTFVGLQGMMDPPRDGVGDAIAASQQAGIRVIMITGDHAKTATAIAEQLGIAGSFDTDTVKGANLQRQWVSENMLLRDYNGGRGVTPGQFRITDSAGGSAIVNLTQSQDWTIGRLIQEINNSEPRHVVTIESPIEYTFRPRQAYIRQREVGRTHESDAQRCRGRGGHGEHRAEPGMARIADAGRAPGLFDHDGLAGQRVPGRLLGLAAVVAACVSIAVPTDDVAKVASLQPGSWVTATSPRRPAGFGEAVADLRPYNDVG